MPIIKPPINILHEDEWIVCVNKPNNLIVHQSKFGGAIDDQSLCQLLKEQLNQRIYPIHRLDRKTSGVLLLAKDKSIIPNLQKQLAEGRATKTYLSLVRGHILKNGIVDTPIRPEEKNEYKEALTIYKPIANYEVDIPVTPYPKSRYTLVELEPKTGRTHQLRKHMNKISHPIIGDPKYGNRHHNHMFMERLNIPFLFLHAYSLAFTHPTSNEKVFIKAPAPTFWKQCFEQFDWELPK